MKRTIPIVVLVGLAAIVLAAPAAADLSSKLGALSGDNAKGYLSPMPKALSATLNSSIFQSGKVPLKSVELSLGIHVMGVNVKDEDRTFLPTDPAGFQSVTPTRVPTIIGDGTAVPVDGVGGTILNYPGGFDIKSFVVAAPELTVGSIFGTRAVVRWISLTVGDSDFGKVDLFGIGGQHSISQYLPKLPVDLACGLFYQTFKLGDGILDTKALHFDVTASRDFGAVVKIAPYVGLGYDTFKMDVAYTSTLDPADRIAVSMDNQSNAHLTLGAQLRLPGVALHGEFNAAANTGAAVGLRFGR
ncbi:MAG TPA: DUF6588 family protein [Terriglobales bacterium]|nr:DUF6588 family protein [Terriglobales bacterium]